LSGINTSDYILIAYIKRPVNTKNVYKKLYLFSFILYFWLYFCVYIYIYICVCFMSNALCKSYTVIHFEQSSFSSQVGAVNFEILHSVLIVLVKHFKLQNTVVDVHGA
jgi:hypothetical protein